MPSVEVFENLLNKGPDNALLRYSLANAYASESRYAEAIEQLHCAVEFDEHYSAAWKLLGKCYLEVKDYINAKATYEKGIAVANAKGDKQAAKEMTVFLKRAVKHVANK